MLRLRDIKAKEWIDKLENYSKPLQTVNTYLYYKQLHESTHLVDENVSNAHIQHRYS